MGEFSIQISNNLVNQLAGERQELRKKKQGKPRSKASQGFLQHKATENDKTKHSPLPFPWGPPQQHASAELEEMRSIVAESDKVIERLQKQEDKVVDETTERAKSLHFKEFKLPYQKPFLPCLADYEACCACYKEHGLRDSLKCAPFVRHYRDCVNSMAKQQASSVGT